MQLVNQYQVDNDEDQSHSEEQMHSRLRVAILDTGIDMSHHETFGDERIKELKSWTGTSADEDTSGHGTHIASTILSLTSNVDVFIAKITDNNFLEDTDRISEVGGANVQTTYNLLRPFTYLGLTCSLNKGYQLRLPGVESRHDILVFWLPSWHPVYPEGDR